MTIKQVVKRLRMTSPFSRNKDDTEVLCCTIGNYFRLPRFTICEQACRVSTDALKICKLAAKRLIAFITAEEAPLPEPPSPTGESAPSFSIASGTEETEDDFEQPRQRSASTVSHALSTCVR